MQKGSTKLGGLGSKSTWQSLGGLEFEYELSKLYSELGYEVSRTRASGDEGIDIFISKDGKTTIVQCKAHKKPVGPSAVRDLYGTLLPCGADDAILASVSGCTAGTRNFAMDKPIKLLGLAGILALHSEIDQTSPF